MCTGVASTVSEGSQVVSQGTVEIGSKIAPSIDVGEEGWLKDEEEDEDVTMVASSRSWPSGSSGTHSSRRRSTRTGEKPLLVVSFVSADPLNVWCLFCNSYNQINYSERNSRSEHKFLYYTKFKVKIT